MGSMSSVGLKRCALAALAFAVIFPLAAQRLGAQARRGQGGGAGGGGPAAGTRIWNCDIVSEERNVTPGASLQPIQIVGARNGTFSGKVVVDAAGMVRGIKASITAISGEGTTIPAANVQVRYAVPWTGYSGGPSYPDILMETPPAEVPAGADRAYAPVWVTIKVPKDAKPGTYSGKLTVEAQGLAATQIPVTLEVTNWTLPDPQDYRVWTDFMESPDTLSLEYKVPMWSDKHWDLIARSFKYISDTGSRTVYVPLICHTNLGNDESMVRWIPKGDGTYDYDFSVMDKYLDSAEKNLGTPKLIIFQVWDICMSKDSLNRGLWGGETDTRKARQELLGQGPRVTVEDPKTKTVTIAPETGEASLTTLPSYEDPASKALWAPVWEQIQKRLVARHLEGTAMLGLMPDLWPTPKEVAFWKGITGGIPWAIHGHAGDPNDVGIGMKGLYGKDKSAASDIGYAAFVYNEVFNVTPSKGRMYGWQDKGILSSYYRNGALNGLNPAEMREYLAFDITGGQRGGGRIGGDFWPVIKDKKGLRQGIVPIRYPENNWRNLDIEDWFLAPGVDGAIATTRLEQLKEGAEECEARIAIESALLDPAAKAKLGDVAAQAQDCLDDLQHAMWKTVWNNDEDLAAVGKTDSEGRNPPEGLWNTLNKINRIPVFTDKKTGKKEDFWGGDQRQLRDDQAAKGQAWFVQDWQKREKKLFDFAGQVAAKVK